MKGIRVTVGMFAVTAALFLPAALAVAAPGGSPGGSPGAGPGSGPGPAACSTCTPTCTSTCTCPCGGTGTCTPSPTGTGIGAASAPRLYVHQLSLGQPTSVPAAAPLRATIRLQIRDNDPAHNVSAVKVQVRVTVQNQVRTTTVSLYRVGWSQQVSQWRGTLTVPAPTRVTARICLQQVTVTATGDGGYVVAHAGDIAGADCLTLTRPGR